MGRTRDKAKLYKRMRDICQSMHKVARAEDLFPSKPQRCVLKCRLNPMRLLCTCKGSRHHGICSHILAYTHLKGQINLHEQLQQLAPRRAAYRPALPKGRNRIQPEEEEGPELPEEEEPEEQDLLGA